MPLIGLLALLLGVYVYFLAMKWLIVAAGPEILLVASLLLIAYVPVAFGKALYGVFASPGPRRFAFVLIVALLVLLYFDFAWLTATTLGQITEARTAPGMGAFFGRVAFGALPNRDIVEWLVARGLDSPAPLILLSAAAKTAVIAPVALFARGLRSDVVASHQPARLQYFFANASADIGEVVHLAVNDIVDLTSRLTRLIIDVNKTPAAITIWPISLTIAVAFLPGLLAGLVFGLGLAIVHSLAIIVASLSNLTLAGVLKASERAVIIARRGHAICPHSMCHRPIPLLSFRCPACSVEHDRLLPGRCGVFNRICQCGERLPALFWFGKGRLPAVCPHCKRSMPSALFTESLHVPIYGGPGAGKSMFMMAGIVGLLDGAVPRLRAMLIDGSLRQAYEKKWKRQFESGRVLDKTSDMFPDAFLLSLERSGGLPLSVYLYDPAGEALEGQDRLAAHEFLRHADSFALVIDPLSLPGLRRQLSPGALPSTTSAVDPREIINRIVNSLEDQGSLDRRRLSRRRVAVVISKADLPSVAAPLGFGKERALTLWSGAGATESVVIRNWLASIEPALVDILEHRFAEVRYFAVSAQGDALGGGFRPWRVLEPLTWLFARRGTLVRPHVWHALGRLRELLAVAVVLGAFGGVAYSLVSLPDILREFSVPSVSDGSTVAGERFELRPAAPPAELGVSPVIERSAPAEQ